MVANWGGCDGLCNHMRLALVDWDVVIKAGDIISSDIVRQTLVVGPG